MQTSWIGKRKGFEIGSYVIDQRKRRKQHWEAYHPSESSFAWPFYGVYWLGLP